MHLEAQFRFFSEEARIRVDLQLNVIVVMLDNFDKTFCFTIGRIYRAPKPSAHHQSTHVKGNTYRFCGAFMSERVVAGRIWRSNRPSFYHSL